jgi:polyisoprenoid-binding protein YceI
MRRAVLLSLVLALSFPLTADAAMKVNGKPKISFFATGSPGFLDIEGVTETVTVADDGTRLTFTVPMDSVKTGIDTRDEHMNHEYVQTAQFPNATLKVDKAAVTWPANAGEKKTGTAKGEFTIHGVAKPVDVTYTVTKSKTGFVVKSKFNFDCSQHGITIPSYLGVTVDPKMYAEVQLELVDA